MILSVFCERFIRMVGPSTAAAAATPAVVTNSRRSIPFRLVIALPSIHTERRLPAKRGASPRRGKRLLSERVHNAQSDLTCVLLTRRRPRSAGAGILLAELVAGSSGPQRCPDIHLF